MTEIDIELECGKLCCFLGRLEDWPDYSCDSVAYECSGDHILYRLKCVGTKQRS